MFYDGWNIATFYWSDYDERKRKKRNTEGFASAVGALRAIVKTRPSSHPAEDDNQKPQDMDESTANTKIWQSLVAVKQYFQYGIARQLRDATSYSGEDALPIIDAYQVFDNVRPFLSPGVAAAVDVAFKTAETGFNNFLDVLRKGVSTPIGNSPERQEAERNALLALNQTLTAYQTELGKVELAIIQSSDR